MKKDSYYFPHFYNARSDRKMLRVRRELGIEGYAIYFMLLEILREQTDFSYPLSDVDLLADEFRTSEQKITTVISSYDLFQVTEDKFFYSQKLIANLQPYLEKSERARLAARKRWDKSKKLDANALLEQSKSNTSQNTKRGEESKGEESTQSKKKYGEYENVKFTEKQYNTLLKEWGELELKRMIVILDEGIQMKPKQYKYSDFNLAIRKWKKNDNTPSIFNQENNDELSLEEKMNKLKELESK